MIFISDSDRETAEKNGINYKNLYNRVYNCGWPIEKAVTKPIKKKTDSLYYQFKSIAQENGITASCFYNRVKRGMSPEEASSIPKITPEDQKKKSYRRKNAKITMDIVETAKNNGISERTLKQRVYILKWPIEQAMTEPIHNRRQGRCKNASY